ncbi:hypothetical protein [Sediminibacterium sp.]|uniref:hypothetical protein n=1 Tax=Sediminibacterium sp. TaxID=1917865 RepID=UPI0025E38290|nr:hypothetical protein [Sediminibacterium sp.]MBT9485298.1 hypothetical protein [Sediminibacterium sp.]
MKQISVIVFYLFGFILFFSCKERQDVGEVRNLKTVIGYTITPKDSSTLYFPENDFLSDTINQLDTFRNAWYSKMLFALHEPVLFKNKDTSEVFRFTWLRTFHNPISIRVKRIEKDYVLTLKITEGSGGYEAGKLIKDTSFFITADEWKVISSKISGIKFWQLKSFINDGGKDGSEWILEGKNRNEYQVVSRWSPNTIRYKEFKDCCDYLIYLSKIKLTNKEIY